MTANPLTFPFDPAFVALKKKRLLREGRERSDLTPKRIAIFSGSSSQELCSFLELFLLQKGFQTEIYQSSYDRYEEEALYPDPALLEFKPDICYVYTCVHNIKTSIPFNATLEEAQVILENELDRFKRIWQALSQHFSCDIIQNTFDPPCYRPLGQLEFKTLQSTSNFIQSINQGLLSRSSKFKNLHFFDWAHLAQDIGLKHWHSQTHWHSYKYATHPDHFPQIAYTLSQTISALWGQSKKVLVCDLDDTLYGGVISEDGMNIELGPGTPRGEAFSDIHSYLLKLKERGILLAIVSKNDDAIARQLFDHPHNLLKPNDFSAILANWKPKSENIRALSKELNLGLDSFVFFDNSHFEREEVRQSLPEVEVPEIGDAPEHYCAILDRAAYFESMSLSEDDLKRNELYQLKQRFEQEAQTSQSYDDFLKSLHMQGRCEPLGEQNIQRVHQLLNKTNQFNLTTQRLSMAECEHLMSDENIICLAGHLRDHHGEHGLVAVISASIHQEHAVIDHFLMSCRVLKRGMESFMLEQLILRLRERRVSNITGIYHKTKKNHQVEDLYQNFGFTQKKLENNEGEAWTIELSALAPYLQHHIDFIT